MLLALGGAFALIAAALALVAIAGAVTGKGRVQRAADLAAISAARSMRDDLPRLLSPPTLPNGLPNPRHIEKAAYLARARAAALDAARANGVGAGAPAGLLPRRGLVRAGAGQGGRRSPSSRSATVGTRGRGIGGGRSGGAVERWRRVDAVDGERRRLQRPARLPAGRGDAARRRRRLRPHGRRARAQAGLALVVNSGFRSDAEQAALFAAHPDPHLGGAARPLAAPLRDRARPRPGNRLRLAGRQRLPLRLRPALQLGGLALRIRRPARRRARRPGTRSGASGGDGALAGGGGLPSFVPTRFRAPLLRAAARWNVSAALLAAQLMAESNFNPFASSPAGAQGIAQFIPATAAAYGLRDPFDPVEAIDAQAHLMSDLIRQFGSPQLALAAYNAGPAPVEACHCVPAIPRDPGLRQPHPRPARRRRGALVAPSFEVRLVA